MDTPQPTYYGHYGHRDSFKWIDVHHQMGRVDGLRAKIAQSRGHAVDQVALLSTLIASAAPCFPDPSAHYGRAESADDLLPIHHGHDGHKTMDVAAGSIVNFYPVMPISHPGPVNFYMAKAPSGISLAEFDGLGPTIPIKLPECLEDGDHLLRIEHIGLH
ncbi:hypothetical protein DL767_011138 [Monosporascus sp. MG133]|nr:hypothetical protein DL767_011138 [Monosporascus sp. MG133]